MKFSRLALVSCLLPSVLTYGCGNPNRTFTLLDSATGLPVEGALVFSPEERTVFRSDYHGVVELPSEYGAQGLVIHAKNHRPAELATAEASGDVVLEFDPELVNPREARMVFDRADSLRGRYGPYRENNDVRTYDLNIKVDVDEQSISGWNTIAFTMTEDGQRVQMDLYEHLAVDSILFQGQQLPFSREANAVFVDFPEPLREGKTYAIDFHYSGKTQVDGRFRGMRFVQDSLGNPWVFTSCQNIGASTWWPNKDQAPDEVDSMTINVTVPSEFTDVSNGKLMGVDDLGDGTTRYRWKVHYPINNYSVSVNIGKYVHFTDTFEDLPLDYYVLPYHLEDARRQFAQAQPMLQCFSDRFGGYPFPRDGYKLVEVGYAGMEHQSAVTYGNGFENGYGGRDWTGVGISPRFDFIIIHESSHEWFGNSVTARDVSDAWIHEGWGTYLEGVYVECMWGYDGAITYLNGYQTKVANREPIIGPPGVNHWPTQDQYFKGALFLNTLRHVVDDDTTWWALLEEYAKHFRYQDIWTTDVINFFNARLDRDLRPIFEQYLYHPELPVLQVRFEGESVSFRWNAQVADFDMPVKVRTPAGIRDLHPTTEWESEPLDGTSPEQWQPATDLFYIVVERL